MSKTRELAEHYYGADGRKMQTADLYQKLSKDAVRAVAVIGVDTYPKPPFFDEESSEGIAGTFLHQVKELGFQHHTAIIDPIAYKIGYDAQLADAATGSYDELEQLAQIYEAATGYVTDQSTTQ